MITSIFLPILVYLSLQSPFAEIYSRAYLSAKEISLENRYANEYVNDVFKDNILLNLAYIRGEKIKPQEINWDDIEKPFIFSFTLSPGKTFAFHDDVLPEFKDKVRVTTNAHFNLAEGFKSDGYLAGDGVCHLASLMYWAAKEAGLDAVAPSNHNFMEIPEIPKKFGVAIYSMPGQPQANALQNLYITNNKEKSVIFEFIYIKEKLKLSIYEQT